MKDQLLDNISDCPNCGKSTSIRAMICKNCGILLANGAFTEAEVFKKIKKLEKSRQRIKQSRYIFYLLALFNLLSTLVKYRFSDELSYISLTISFIYLTLGLLSFRWSMGSFFIGFFLYIGVSGSNLFGFLTGMADSGIFIHIIALAFLTLGLVNSFTQQRIQKELYGN